MVRQVPFRRVLQESELDALALDDRRLVCPFEVGSAPRMRDMTGIEQRQALENVVRAVGDIISHADDRDVAGLQRAYRLRAYVLPTAFVGNILVGPLGW